MAFYNCKIAKPSEIRRLTMRRTQALRFSTFARGVLGAAQLLVFGRQEGMRLGRVRLDLHGLLQIGLRIGESPVQKEHTPQKQVCTVVIRLPLKDYEKVFGRFLR